MPDHTTVSDLKMMTQGLPGVGGVFRSEPSDFFVEEIPLLSLKKKGAYCHFLIEKRGLTTAEAVEAIAHAMGKRNRDVGYAGLKDTHAVTRQWISMERVAPDRVRRLKLRHIKILEWGRHDHPIKVGCLKGNRFRIRIRQVNCPMDEALSRTRDILSVLCERGMPNAFGPQRFGNRGNSHELGKAVVLGQKEAFLDLFLGDPRPEDSPSEHRVRSLYSRGQFNKALKACPAYLSSTRRVLAVLVRVRGDKRKAFDSVPKGRVKFLVSAYQSFLFNQVLTVRMPDIDRLMTGDIAYRHDKGDTIHIKDPTQEQAGCTQFEISPTGPIYGFDMDRPSGKAGKIENAALHKAQVSRLLQSTHAKAYLASGGRRPLRVLPDNVSASCGRSKNGEYLELKFDLTSGSYATVLLREVMK